jgi:hypothetical protein
MGEKCIRGFGFKTSRKKKPGKPASRKSMILKLLSDKGWNCIDCIQLTMERDQLHKES